MKEFFEKFRKTIEEKNASDFKKAHYYLKTRLTNLIVNFSITFSMSIDIRDELGHILAHFFRGNGPIWPEAVREMAQLESLLDVIESLIVLRTPEQLRAVIRDNENMWLIITLINNNQTDNKYLKNVDIAVKTGKNSLEIGECLRYLEKYGIIRLLPPFYDPYIELTGFGQSLL
ncbi:hypothetical protein A2303_07770 [Candidatus Falkowbacteria bacterium RIFOXYB2_FULL_47_14]|uniref:Uncharacterized protein n=1 Tax=Candidatus Falkowbacteria bacterium RIFOXYA2_FULL_47_19 TaxID=1797994 RepID=A0A1F5SML4_9BACT|nr:MAG: hypothetical protein A2227_04915 [Candidatus Falkowbacteria bacterium RIFOXYA2_FULL_47_19]OGF36026.1 MAG: hypothetical protein A2468_00620 [Candidatus Falkowbacteria bacterium RIFOXYC2_FULL_46_15]OGF43416.1 MAG: hypothetical protein A2303_07770 [Candidatus Falkowbacteria bacterium RIFOXYB2_FULL_47_14]